MDYYTLQPSETVLYTGEITIGNRNSHSVLTLTNINFIIITTTKKLFAKDQVQVDTYPVEDVKIYNNTPQIKQKNNTVEVFLTRGELNFSFGSMFEARKFVSAALRLLTGKTTAERGANTLKATVGLVDDTLGINTIGTVKNVLENGVMGSLLGGITKKAVPSSKKSALISEAIGIAKEVADTKAAQAQLPTAEHSMPSDQQLEQLKKLKELVDMGVLTQEEFDAKKAQILGL